MLFRRGVSSSLGFLGASVVVFGTTTGSAQQAKAPPKASIQAIQPFTERAERNSFLTYPNACFPAGSERFLIDKAPAASPEDCVQRCDAMGACAAYEIWEHTKVCKLYSDAPRAPVHQLSFPQNKVDNRQAQAWLGVKKRF